MFRPLLAQEVWRESFSVPDKGVWGNGEGSLVTDFSGITSWTLDYVEIKPIDSDDYAKTVSTSGGRFEVRDVNGEVVWRSEWIDIAGLENVTVQLVSAETGSGSNTSTKYMNVFYKVDEGEEILFSENGSNAGNWGTLTARQEGISGSLLQVVCYLSNHYSSDKVILDEVSVTGNTGQSWPVNPNEVVINELMADPYPREGLPDVEFIELYNTLDVPVYIAGWKLRIDSIAKKISDSTIEPGGYLLLCAAGSVDSLSSFGAVAAVSGFQGLRNSGAVVEIVSSEGATVDRIEYTNDWYGDELKGRGGWSLERIDPRRFCNQPGNWKASLNSDGGTPGYRNSVNAENSDVTPPSVKRAVAVSESLVEVAFTEPPGMESLLDSSCYTLSEYGNPDKTEVLTDRNVLLHFREKLRKDKIYRLSIVNVADDCGNTMDEQYTDVQWNTIETGDVLVNEVLFDPFPGADDYVEIYNISDKLIDLSRLSLANRNSDYELNDVFDLTTERSILFPGEYLALTKDTGMVFPWYTIQCRYCFLQMESVPSLPDDKGCVVLLNEEDQIIDEFCYNEGMHSPFLADAEGVSLERVSHTRPAGAFNNWQSAAKDSGYGTPGAENSVAAGAFDGKPSVVFEPEAFSPDYDGYNDEYVIHYEFAKPGFVANLKVFDEKGMFIMHLLKNETWGTSGSFRWNGENETGNLLPVGVYVVLLELFNAEGEFYRFKDGVILTRFYE